MFASDQADQDFFYDIGHVQLKNFGLVSKLQEIAKRSDNAFFIF
jgi:hypothetical protein